MKADDTQRSNFLSFLMFCVVKKKQNEEQMKKRKKKKKKMKVLKSMTPRLATRRSVKGLPVATLPLCAHFVHYS